MTRRHRIVARRIWLVLAPVLAAVLALAMLATPAESDNADWPPVLAAPSGEG